MCLFLILLWNGLKTICLLFSLGDTSVNNVIGNWTEGEQFSSFPVNVRCFKVFARVSRLLGDHEFWGQMEHVVLCCVTHDGYALYLILDTLPKKENKQNKNKNKQQQQQQQQNHEK